MPRNRVLGILAGEDMPLSLLGKWAASADVVLAADGGADRLQGLKIVPDAAIGDLDSISQKAREAQHHLILDPDQDSTDCDKLLALAAKLGHTEITLASIEGDLLDHMLGTLSSAIATPLQVRLALRRGLGWILKGDCVRAVRCAVGARISLMPLAESTQASLSGVQWPIMDWHLRLGEKTSLSNRATREQIAVRQRSGASLLFVEYPEDDLPQWPGDEEPGSQ